jgi:hypothetical protein
MKRAAPDRRNGLDPPGSNDAPIWMPWKIAFDETFIDGGPGALTLADLTERLLQEAQAQGEPLDARQPGRP